MNKPLSIRDLQRVSAETISALDGPTPVKSGDRTVAILIPLKSVDKARFRKALLRAEEWAKGRDTAADDRALEAFGPVDKTDWSFAAMRQAKQRAKRKK